jgi:hypothetical protein
MFEPGNKYGAGRPLGSKNKSTLQSAAEFKEALKRNNFNVPEALIEMYQNATRDYKSNRKKLKQGRISPMEDNGHKYLRIAADVLKEIASYCYAKQKAVEHTNVNPLEGMTPEQKLQAMKQAILLLEMEISGS